MGSGSGVTMGVGDGMAVGVAVGVTVAVAVSVGAVVAVSVGAVVAVGTAVAVSVGTVVVVGVAVAVSAGAVVVVGVAADVSVGAVVVAEWQRTFPSGPLWPWGRRSRWGLPSAWPLPGRRALQSGLFRPACGQNEPPPGPSRHSTRPRLLCWIPNCCTKPGEGLLQSAAAPGASADFLYGSSCSWLHFRLIIQPTTNSTMPRPASTGIGQVSWPVWGRSGSGVTTTV